MPVAKEISSEARRKLRKIRRLRGVSDFCEKAQINERTFQKLVDEGFSYQEIVDRVEDVLENGVKKAPAGTVELVVSTIYGTTPEVLRGPSRNKKNLVEARQIAMLLMKKLGKMKPAQIAPCFGYSDHTGVVNAIKALERRLDVETELKSRVSNIKQKVLAAC